MAQLVCLLVYGVVTCNVTFSDPVWNCSRQSTVVTSHQYVPVDSILQTGPFCAMCSISRTWNGLAFTWAVGNSDCSTGYYDKPVPVVYTGLDITTATVVTYNTTLPSAILPSNVTRMTLTPPLGPTCSGGVKSLFCGQEWALYQGGPYRCTLVDSAFVIRLGDCPSGSTSTSVSPAAWVPLIVSVVLFMLSTAILVRNY